MVRDSKVCYKYMYHAEQSSLLHKYTINVLNTKTCSPMGLLVCYNISLIVYCLVAMCHQGFILAVLGVSSSTESFHLPW